MMPPLRYCTLLVLLVMVGLCMGCAGKRTRATADEQQPPSTPARTFDDAEVTLNGGTVRFPDSGPRIWVMQANTMHGTAADGTLRLRQVSCELHEQDRVTMTITADNAETRIDGTTAHLTLRGHVQARAAARGLELWADRLQWQSDADDLRGSGLRLRGLGVEHAAERGVVSTDLTEATFDGNVRTQSIGAQAP